MAAATTETLSFNASNWSGKTVETKVDRNAGTLELHGDTFTLERMEWGHPEDAHLLGPHYYCIRSDVYGLPVGGEREMSLGVIYAQTDYKTGEVKRWEAHQDPGFGINRAHVDPFVAAAQLLCNTL